MTTDRRELNPNSCTPFLCASARNVIFTYTADDLESDTFARYLCTKLFGSTTNKGSHVSCNEEVIELVISILEI